jgi:hypothetical protein
MLKRNDTASFDVLAFFEGRTLADGIFEDRSGKVKRRFTVDMTGKADGNTLTLDEAFLFDDGERETRTWILQRGEGQTFTGTCADAVTAAHGRFEPGRAYLSSELRIAVGSRRIAMRFDDVFYQTGGGTVLNRSTVSKWGIRVGQVLILFRKA